MFAFLSCSPFILAATFATFHAGQQSFSFEAPQIAATVRVASDVVHGLVWYPADGAAPETAQYIGAPDAPLFEAGSVAPDAPVITTREPFPLVLLSHGTGGSARQMAWLGTALARAGFIAVAIDHPGNTAAGTPTVEGFTMWWERPRELSLALDAILADARFESHVDRTRIAAAGFSLGGYTAIGLAGARVDMERLLAYCADHPSTAGNCQSPLEFPDLVKNLHARMHDDPVYARAMAESGASVRDDRVRAAFAIAPAEAESVTPASLRAITVPAGIAYGTADTIAAPEQNAIPYAATIPGATLLPVEGAGHYTFLDSCTATGMRTIGAPVCGDAAGIDRDAAHAIVANDAIAFFDRVLEVTPPTRRL